MSQNVEHHVCGENPIDPFRKFSLVQSHGEEKRDYWKEFAETLSPYAVYLSIIIHHSFFKRNALMHKTISSSFAICIDRHKDFDWN